LSEGNERHPTPVKSFDDHDEGNQLPDFQPSRPPGVHLNSQVLRGHMTKAIHVFQLLFTQQLLSEICQHTNSYAWLKIPEKLYYGDWHGAWTETTEDELWKLIALIIYFGLVNVSSFHHYWSTKTLYHGLWARAMMSRDRFKALMAMLHVSDFGTEDSGNKLRRCRSSSITFLLNVKTYINLSRM
jgi:hypothetical protein